MLLRKKYGDNMTNKGIPALCCLTLCMMSFGGCSSNIKNIQLKQGDKINELSYRAEGKKKEKFDIKDDTVLFYVSDTCAGCMEKLPLIEDLNKICKDDINISMVFDGIIPEERLGKYELTGIDTYTLDNMYSFSQSMPHYYFVENNTVIKDFGSNEEFIATLVEKMSEKNDFQQKAFDVLSRENSGKTSILFVDDIYSGTDKDKIVISNSETENYEYDVYDNLSFYSKVFGIENYPSEVTMSDGKVNVF